MLKLSTRDYAPTWLDLVPGVRVQVRPATVATMLVARNAAAKVLRDEDREDAAQHANIALTRELARRSIVGWEGIGDEAGEPVAVSPETVDALMDVWPAFDAFDRLYVGPALVGDAEKNGSSNAPGGTSGEAPNTAGPAA